MDALIFFVGAVAIVVLGAVVRDRYIRRDEDDGTSRGN